MVESEWRTLTKQLDCYWLPCDCNHLKINCQVHSKQSVVNYSIWSVDVNTHLTPAKGVNSQSGRVDIIL